MIKRRRTDPGSMVSDLLAFIQQQDDKQQTQSSNTKSLPGEKVLLVLFLPPISATFKLHRVKFLSADGMTSALDCMNY